MSPIARSKHAVLLDMLTDATEAVRVLREDGHYDLAKAVRHVTDYARDNARAELNAAAARQPNARALAVSQAFRDHVHRVAEDEEMNPSKVVRDNLQEFLNGKWMPAAPPARAPRGSGPKKVNLNVRVAQDVWDDVNDLGKDPAAVAERGYKLTAAQVAVAALEETFGRPPAEAESAGD